MPTSIQHLPLDPRGYPVPVTVPWASGRPKFASMSSARTLLIARHGLCGICGLALGAGEPYWRNSDADDADIFEAVLEAGTDVVGIRSPEAGGHRECVLFAAMTCPFLSQDASRRTEATDGSGATRPKGERRGREGLVTAHQGWEFEASASFIGFHLGKLLQMSRYERGEELVEELKVAMAEAPERVERPGAPRLWTMTNESAVEALAVAAIGDGGGTRSVGPKAGRNDRCPCGSGRKFKICHGR